MKMKKVTIRTGIVCVLILAAVIILFAASADSGEQGTAPAEAENTAGGTESEDTNSERTGELEEDTASEDSAAEQNTAQGEDAAAAERQPGTARESTTVIQCTIEGNLEEMPATLYVGDGFSMYIPDEGWQIYEDEMVLPVKMSAVRSAEISLWVEYYEEGVADTEERLLSEGCAYGPDGGKLQRQDGEILTEFRIFGDENESWLICSRRPGTSESEEGMAVRLDAIAGTFAVMAEQGEAESQMASGPNSAEAAALEEVMMEFYTAYFNGDEEGIRQYLSADFSGTPEVYDAPETAGDIEIREIKSFVDMTESEDNSFEQYSQSVEFVAPGEDSFTYLSVDFVKENGEWKVLSYGLEK